MRRIRLLLLFTLFVIQAFAGLPNQAVIDQSGNQLGTENVPQGTGLEDKSSSAVSDISYSNSNTQISEPTEQSTSDYTEQNDDWYDWHEAETVRVTQSFPFFNNIEYESQDDSPVYSNYQPTQSVTEAMLSDDGIYQEMESGFEGQSSTDYYSIVSISTIADSGTVDIDNCASSDIRFHEGNDYCEIEETMTDMSGSDRIGYTVTIDVHDATTGYIVLNWRGGAGRTSTDELTDWVTSMYTLEGDETDGSGHITFDVYYQNDNQDILSDVVGSSTTNDPYIDTDPSSWPSPGVLPAGYDHWVFHLDYFAFFPDTEGSTPQSGVSGTYITTTSDIVDTLNREVWSTYSFQINQDRVLHDIKTEFKGYIDAMTTDSSTSTSFTTSDAYLEFYQNWDEIFPQISQYYSLFRYNMSAQFLYDDDGSDYFNITVSLAALADDVWETAISSSSISSDLSTQYIYVLNSTRLEVDYLNIQRPTIEFQQRAERKFNPDDPSQGLMRLEIITDTFGSNVTVSPGIKYDLTDINPYSKVTWDSSYKDLWFISTYVGKFVLKFAFGPGWGRDYPRQPVIGAWSDVTDTIMECPSFECGSNKDWTYNDGSSLLNTDIITSTVSSGSFAMNVTSADTSAKYLFMQGLLDGGFYIYFDYYIPEAISGTLYLQMPTLSVSYSIATTSTVTNRWHHFFQYVEFDTTTYDWFRLLASSFVGSVIIDNWRIFKAGGVVETVGPNEFESSVQFLTVPNFVPMPSIQVHNRWAYRADDTEIFQKTVWTDENGIASYIFKGSLEAKEYENRWWSFDSYIGTNQNYELEDTSYFDQAGILGSGGSFSVSYEYSNVKRGGKAIKFEVSDTDTDNAMLITPPETWVVDDYGFYHVQLYSNISITGVDFTFYDVYSSKYYVISGVGDLSANQWTTFNIDLSSAISSLPDLSIEKVRIDFDMSSPYYVLYDDAHFTSRITSYFTPLPAGAHSYSYASSGLQNQNKNFWDFSEGTTEGFDDPFGASLSVDNGELNIVPVNSSGTIQIGTRTTLSQSIDTSMYEKAILRIKVNNTNALSLLDIREYAGGSIYFQNIHNYISSNDTYFLLSLDPTSSWDGDISQFRLRGIFSDYIKITIDFIGFTDSWDQGHGWEFEEPNYLEGWDSFSGATVEKKDHSISLTKSTGDNFWGIRKQIENLDTSKTDRLELIYKSTEYIDGINIATYDASTNYISNAEIPDFELNAVSEWTYYSIDLSFDSDWDGDIHFDGLLLNFLDSSSGGEIVLELNSIRFVDDDTSNDLKVDSTTGAFYFDNGNNSTEWFNTWMNGSYYGTFPEYQINYLQMQSSSTYSFTYAQIFSDGVPQGTVQIPGTIYEYEYTVLASDLTTINLVDDEGQYLDARSFAIYVDGTRIRGDTFLWDDISSSKTIQIEDFWGNVLYSASESFSRFLDYTLTLYSVKIFNQMDTPIFLSITNGPVFSSWILPGEIEEYQLRSDNYNFTLQYSTELTSFSAATLNGTTLEYVYAVTADTALVVSDFSILDVYANLIDLSSTLSSVNGTLYAELGDLELQIDLSNSTQVDLLLANYEELLLAQQYSSEYMSEFRPEIAYIRDIDASSGAIQFDFQSNWQNATHIEIYVNSTLVSNSTSEGSIISFYDFGFGYYNITFYVYYLGQFESGYLYYEYGITVSPPDLGLFTVYYDIVVLDGDGYIFVDFPLLVYYDDVIISRNLLPLRANETFDKSLLSFGNEQGFSFTALNVTLHQSASDGIFVVLVYLDLVRIYFENSGTYTTRLNISRIPGNYTAARNETVEVPTGGRFYWLPTGNYSAIKFDIIEEEDVSDGDTVLRHNGFISSMKVSSALSERSFDASSTRVGTVIDNKIEVGSTQRAVSLIGAVGLSAVLLFLLYQVGGKIFGYSWDGFVVKWTGKNPKTESLEWSDLWRANRHRSKPRRSIDRNPFRN